MKPQASLFRRTAVTMALGLLVFQLTTGTAIIVNLVLPLAYRSAEDLADVLVLSARVWTELPPEKRLLFEAALSKQQGLIVSQPVDALPEALGIYPYIRFLRAALILRLTPDQHPRLSEQAHENFQVEFMQAGQRLRFEFSKDRIPPRPSWALAWILMAGVLFTFALAWLLARRVTAPVARLADAARRIGSGDQPAQLPEAGAAEFADLARVFNQTSRQLQARRENQTTLLAGVSHDLRSPLARMKMALGMLAEDCKSPLVERMERDINEMDELIGAQLALARAQEAEQPVLTDVDALLEELVEVADAQKPGYLRLRLGSDRFCCRTSIAQMALRRCVGNLLNNALRYGGEQPVQVVRRRMNGMLLIGVRDRGPGIPSHQIDAVFRPFYRLESSRNRTTGGSGLGLAITRQLAETHGWTVAFKAHLGGGACFWMMIREKDC